jgi:putative NADH-flavin reductase
MKLVVFGATGAVGRHLVDQALSHDHQVTAFTRSRGKLRQAHENLRVVEGDVLNLRSVASAIDGHDVVLCALGKPLMNREKARAAGTRNIIGAMEATGVQRLVCLSALGAGESRAILPFQYKFILVPLVMRHLYADHDLQERHVRDSPLDWVIVRPSNFSKGPRTGSYRHGFATLDKDLRLKISEADVADFMLSQVADDTYLRQSPGLSS